MESEISSSTDELRHLNRECIRELRKDGRSELLRHRRLNLFEVEQDTRNLSLKQFKDTLLKLKSRKCSVNALKTIKNACIHEKCIEAFFRTDFGLDMLIRILISNDTEKQLEAVACLINLACAKHKVACKISKRCGVYLITFISSSSHFLQDLSAWAVGNLTLNCTECFHLLKAQGILPALFSAMKTPTPSVLQSLLFALNACMQYEDSDVINLMQSDLVEYLLNLINQESTPLPLLMDSSFILAKFCYLGILNHLNFINVSTAERIFLCIYNQIQNKKSSMVLVPLLRCLGYLFCEEVLCKYLLQKECLCECLNELMTTEYEYLRREILWILTNILGSDACDANLLNNVLKTDNIEALLKTGEPFVLQVIYFLTSLAAKERNYACLLKAKTPDFVHNLLKSEDPCVQNALKVFFTVINCDVPCS